MLDDYDMLSGVPRVFVNQVGCGSSIVPDLDYQWCDYWHLLPLCLY